jgi:hypothetical protein
VTLEKKKTTGRAWAGMLAGDSTILLQLKAVFSSCTEAQEAACRGAQAQGQSGLPEHDQGRGSRRGRRRKVTVTVTVTECSFKHLMALLLSKKAL